MMAVMDDNRGPEFLAIFGTGTAIATVLVSLRLWVRSRIVRKVGLDDWIIAASMVGFSQLLYFHVDRVKINWTRDSSELKALANSNNHVPDHCFGSIRLFGHFGSLWLRKTHCFLDS